MRDFIQFDCTGELATLMKEGQLKRQFGGLPISAIALVPDVAVLIVVQILQTFGDVFLRFFIRTFGKLFGLDCNIIEIESERRGGRNKSKGQQ